MAEGRQYIVDENGDKTAVVLPLEQYEELMDDLEDLAVIAERRANKIVGRVVDSGEWIKKEEGIRYWLRLFHTTLRLLISWSN